jgi:hypothetical protein
MRQLDRVAPVPRKLGATELNRGSSSRRFRRFSVPCRTLVAPGRAAAPSVKSSALPSCTTRGGGGSAS